MKIEDITKILQTNPNREYIEYGVKKHKELEFIVNGEHKDSMLESSEYFEDKQVAKERKKNALSNKDLFADVLQKESMVFNARGGSVIYSDLDTNAASILNKYFDTIYNGHSLRHWIKEIADEAYKVDPMGVVFIEKEEDEEKYYPTYKSIKCIYDYYPEGQTTPYIAFNLDEEELTEYTKGVVKFENDKFRYFRFVDEESDRLFKMKTDESKQVIELTEFSLPHNYGICPAIIISDIPCFHDEEMKQSKIHKIEELARAYMYDRSVNQITKLYHSSPKLVEPIAKCNVCKGEGTISDNKMCPVCGGSGNKVGSKVADSLKIPLEMLAENVGLDIKKIFTYITPDIATWDKQDNSLIAQRQLIKSIYWGEDNRQTTTGANKYSNIQETATKTMANLQPIYARLDRTAQWAERLESDICNIIAPLLNANCKEVKVMYGRDYILESTDELFTAYVDAKTKGAPIFQLNDMLERYYQSKYNNNPIELNLALKMMEVEPFIHSTIAQCLLMNLPSETLAMKIYFNDWYSQTKNDQLFSMQADKLRESLRTFVKDKQLSTNVSTQN